MTISKEQTLLILSKYYGIEESSVSKGYIDDMHEAINDVLFPKSLAQKTFEWVKSQPGSRNKKYKNLEWDKLPETDKAAWKSLVDFVISQQ